MTISKYLLAMPVAAIRKELTIQKAPPVQRKTASEKIGEDKILRAGLNGFAMLGLICLVVGWAVFL